MMEENKILVYLKIISHHYYFFHRLNHLNYDLKDDDDLMVDFRLLYFD